MYKRGDSVQVFVSGNILGKYTEKWINGVVLEVDESAKYKPYKVQYRWHTGTSWNWVRRDKIRICV